MSLRKYFNILNLPETATAAEIRSQYRKLAMRYHPDRNPTVQAKEHFLEITNAYEILTGKKQAPKSTGQHISRSKEKTNEDRVKEAKKRYYEQQIKEQHETDIYFKSLFRGKKWRLIKLTSVVGILLSVLIIADYFLPKHYEKDRLAYYAKNIHEGYTIIDNSLVRTEKNNDFWISKIDYSLYAEFPEVYIERSWIFHQPINVISIQKIDYAFYPIAYTFYSVGYILILIFLLPLLTQIFKRKTVWFTVLYHLSLYLTSLLMVIFLLSNDHWAHILTFGFL